MKKLKTALFGVILFGVLVAILHFSDEYHFYYVEQFQLFQQTWAYVGGKLFQPGGLAMLMGEYLTQFFILPVGGPVVVAALLTAVGLLIRVVVRRILPSPERLEKNFSRMESGPLIPPLASIEWYVLYVLPVLALLLIQFSFNYLLQGTVSYAMLLGFLSVYIYIPGFRYRMAGSLLFVPLLFWWGGSVAALLVICMIAFEMTQQARSRWPILLTGLEFAVIATGSVYLSVVNDWRFAVLPDMYFHHLLTPPTAIYFAWIALPLLIVVAFLIRRLTINRRKGKVAVYAVQAVMVVALTGWLVPKYIDTNSLQLKKLDYLARTGQWDEVIAVSGGPIKNYLYLGYLNMALAEKGELGDRLFFFDQHGPLGIFCEWNKTFAASCLLSDVYFTFGEIALSQQMAFESLQSVIGDGNPRNLQRLVQTNLIYGEYAVAERYIRLLEHTFGYKDWAKEHRRFLYNDAAVEADPLLGTKRRFLPVRNTLAHLHGIESDLTSRIEHAPEDRLPVQLMGAVYLLGKDMNSFKHLIELYYGTPALPVLPYSFQEAVILLDDNNPAYWQRFNVSDNVIQRFAGYRDMVMRNRNNMQALPGLLNSPYGNSFWYYYVYKK